MRKPKIVAAVVGAATAAIVATGLTAALAGTADAATQPASRALTCSASQVRATWDLNATQTAGPGENVAVLKLRNHSRQSCTVSGFPTVVLRAADFDWKLKHSGKNRTYKLNPGASASLGIGYVRVLKDDSRAVQPSKVSVTLAGQKKAVTISWPYGDIANQSAMSHPQTYSGGFFR
jgi:hypothetical protein